MSGGIILGVAAGTVGAALLPILGFGSAGIIGGSIAASWQSALGAVTSGSTFAILQSLGATGLGKLLFGSIGAAAGLLTMFASLF